MTDADIDHPKRTLRERLALNLSPVFLRIALAVVFFWAGAIKFLGTGPVGPDDARMLAEMGVLRAPETAPGEAAFPEGAEIKNVYYLALMLRQATNPEGEIGERGETLPPYWPPILGRGPWPVILAYTVAGTEVVCGVLVLAGLITRLWALGLAGVMLGAIWLTQIGPAYQRGDLFLGFLPNYPLLDGQAWSHFLYQFVLLMTAMAVALSGAGKLSLDALLFRRVAEEPAEED